MSAWFASHLRRLLPVGFLAALALLAWLAARGTTAGADELARAARALARTQAWSLFLLAAPLLALRAASAARPATHAPWLAGGAHRLVAAAGPVSAALAGSFLLAGLLFAASEAALDGSTPVRSLVARPPSLERVLHEEDSRLRWSVARPPGATHARLALGLATGSAPTVVVALELVDGAERRSLEQRLAARTVLELELPPESTGTLGLELERRGAGALVLLDGEGLELLAPAASERRAALVFALHAGLALAAIVVLAQVLASVLRPALAAALALALALIGTRALAPWSSFATAWGELELGREPGWPEPLDGLVPLSLACLAAWLLVRTRRGGTP